MWCLISVGDMLIPCWVHVYRMVSGHQLRLVLVPNSAVWLVLSSVAEKLAIMFAGLPTIRMLFVS